ncbi:MAG: patatin-like phospholipase family protein [Candidatus Obscuribacterales bacterium]
MQTAASFLTIILTVLTLTLTMPPALSQTESAGSKPRVALALGGGGARGAAHVGVLEVLEKEGLKPDLIVGISMGAIVGGLYCAGVPLSEIEHIMESGEIKKAFKPVPVPVQIMKKAIRKLAFWREKEYPGFYSGQALEDFVNDQVDEDKRLIENLDSPFAAIAVDLTDGQAYRLTRGNLGRAVRASSSVPPIFKPVEEDDHVYADGGIRANLPTFPARDLGADVVIAVNVDEELSPVSKDELKSYGRLADRLSTILLAVRDNFHETRADLVLRPDVTGISLLSIKNEDYQKAIEAGRQAARQNLDSIRQLFAEKVAAK